MKCFPLLPCYGGPIVEMERTPEFDTRLTYLYAPGVHRQVDAGFVEPEDMPKIGDILVIEGPSVLWMTPDEFAEYYEEIPDVAKAAE